MTDRHFATVITSQSYDGSTPGIVVVRFYRSPWWNPIPRYEPVATSHELDEHLPDDWGIMPNGPARLEPNAVDRTLAKMGWARHPDQPWLESRDPTCIRWSVPVHRVAAELEDDPDWE